MPPFISAAMIIAELAIKFAPVAEGAYKKVRDMIAQWSTGGLISVAQQKVLMDWSNEHERATLAGEMPPALVIDAD